jgi:hypothetical protein
MRIGVIVLMGVVICSPALAFDVSLLPQTCKDTLAEMQSEKARFGQLGLLMAKFQKAKDIDNFCIPARETVTMIKNQSGKIENCLGDVANYKNIPSNTIDQLTKIKAAYKTMMEAAKDPQNDKFHCGLADQ